MQKYSMKLACLSSLVFLSCSVFKNDAKRNIASLNEDLSQNCKVVGKFENSVAKTCSVNGVVNEGKKQFYLLELKADSFERASYHHGYLLAKEVAQGSLTEALANFDKAKAQLSPVARSAFEGIQACFVRKLRRSMSSEFMSGVKGLYAGYAQKMQEEGKSVEFSYDDFELANFSIELGNIIVGLLYRFENQRAKELIRLTSNCGLTIKSSVINEIANQFIGKGGLKNKFACSGIVATKKSTVDGKLIHARNLEQTSMIHTWNRYPVIAIHKIADKLSFVGFGTAGLIFPGGISGYNEHGISVSLFQMNPNTLRYHMRRESVDLMPFIQQKVLMEAKTIDEAIEIIKSRQALSSWTMLISDSKNHEVASIEVSPRKTVVARREVAPEGMAQSNHFQSHQMQDQHHHNRYSNYLETTSRFLLARDMLRDNKKKFDLQLMLDTLSDRRDYFEKTKRTFGRGLARASNIMTTVVVPEDHKAIVSVGDVLPANEGAYVSFDVDFTSNTLVPSRVMSNSVSDISEKKSYTHYVQGFIKSVGRDYQGALREITKAYELYPDLHYLYIQARLYGVTGDHHRAVERFKLAIESFQNIHPYTQARIYLYMLYSEMFLHQHSSDKLTPEQRQQYYEYAKDIFDTVLAGGDSVMPQFRPYIHGKKDLENKKNLLEQVYKNDMSAPLDFPDLNTVD